MKNNDILKSALTDDFSTYWDGIDDNDVQCSLRFEKRMDALLDKNKSSYGKLKKTRRIISRQLIAACFAIVFIFAASCMTVFAVKEATAGFSIIITPHGLKIGNITLSDGSDTSADSDTCGQLSASVNDVITQKYMPEMPKEYEQTYFFENDHVVMANFECNGKTVQYAQRILSTSEYVKDTHYEIQKFVSKGVEYVFFTSENNNTLLWNDRGYSFSMSSPELSCDELRNISNTLKLYE